MVFFSILEYCLIEIGLFYDIRKPSIIKWIKARENWKWFLSLGKLVLFSMILYFRNDWIFFSVLEL